MATLRGAHPFNFSTSPYGRSLSTSSSIQTIGQYGHEASDNATSNIELCRIAGNYLQIFVVCGDRIDGPAHYFYRWHINIDMARNKTIGNVSVGLKDIINLSRFEFWQSLLFQQKWNASKTSMDAFFAANQ